MSTEKSDSHDLGLQHDLEVIAQRLTSRRQMLGWMLSSGAVVLLGGSMDAEGDPTSSAAAGRKQACVANPRSTAGPFPANGSNSINGKESNVLTTSGIVRSDIRSSFGGSKTVAPGVPVTLKMRVVNTNKECVPLAGYAVYLWHCTRDGDYSLYSSKVQTENFLRGVQVTNDKGEVTFKTIYPGCYAGRYPHMHFEIYPSIERATSHANKVFTSQLVLPQDISNEVYKSVAGYERSVGHLANLTTSKDFVFAGNSAAEIAAMTPAMSGKAAEGYSADIAVGIAV